MGVYFGLVIVVLFFLILLLLLIGFIFLWLYVAKKENLHNRMDDGKGKGKKEKLRTKIGMPIVKAGEYVGPTAMKYPFFADQVKDEKLLVNAGSPFGIKLQSFYGLRYVLGFTALFLSCIYAFLGMPFALFLLFLLPFSAYFGPHLWLVIKARQRQEAISVMMPDFLDTVSVTLQAGVGLDNALYQVTKHFEGPLIEEMERFLREVDLGVPRIAAYKNLLARNTAKELEMLVNSIIQGTTLGVPVSTTFRIQADDLRAMRGYKAKEKAAKASPQITLVTTFFVAPAVFFLIIGLLFLNVIYNPEAFGLDTFFN